MAWAVSSAVVKGETWGITYRPPGSSGVTLVRVPLASLGAPL
jgi:hypothetical protein